MPTDPSLWAEVLNTTGPLGLALIVLVVLLASSVALNALLVRFILKDERIPKVVWIAETESHAKDAAAIDTMAEAVKELIWMMRALTTKLGGM
jgi:hypothetical protein